MDSIRIPNLVHEEIEHWAQKTPANVAIRDNGLALRFDELNARANRLARALIARGAGRETIVGIALPRGLDFIVAALAVLKAGCTYLPLDPANPKARLRTMMAVANCRYVIAADRESAGALSSDAALVGTTGLEAYDPQNLALRIDPDALAYIIFTSGSTGQPKGVMIRHRSLAAHTHSYADIFELSASDRTAPVASPGFDAHIVEIWPFLTVGASLVIPSAETRQSPRELQAWIVANEITVTFVPTPMAELMLQLPWPERCALRKLLTAGDRLHTRPHAELTFRLVNMYGPTENTVIASYGVVSPRTPENEGALPSIGKPFPGTEIHILDANSNPVPEGEVGEIHLKGLGLAKGYLGDDELTAQRFVAHVSAGSEARTIYRTGDLGRRLPDGRIEFCGRCDNQVKIGGVRVEPGEIVHALTEHPDVLAAYVAIRRLDASGSPTLTAYIVPSHPERVPSTRGLTEHLRHYLPVAMLVQSYVIMDELPLNAAGKVDAAALPLPSARRSVSIEYIAPQSDLERTIAATWSELLHVERVGAADDFFDLGGNSLLAIQSTTRIAEVLSADVPVRALFDHPRLSDFAEAVRVAVASSGGKVLARVEPRSRAAADGVLSVQQEQVWFLQKLAPSANAYQAQTTIHVRGKLDLNVLARALTEIARRHELLRTTYEEVDGRPRPVVHEVQPMVVAVVDLSSDSDADRETRRQEIVREELLRPIPLDRLPLARWTAIRLGPEETELVMVEHHIIHDGYSFAVLMRELDVIYRAFARGESPRLEELSAQYGDFAAWQRQALTSPSLEGQLAYWRNQLAGAPTDLSLLTDHPRPPVQSFHGDMIRIELPGTISAAVRSFSQRQGVTLFSTLFAAFAALMHRYTDQSDVCIGSGFANRGVANTEDIIGMFVNTVVLRSRMDDATTFRSLVVNAQDTILDAAANQGYPFPKLVEALKVARDPSRNPFVQTMFSFHDASVSSPRFSECSSTIYERGNGSAKLDLGVIAIPHGARHLGDGECADDRISMMWEYNCDLFDRATIERMIGHFVRLLGAAVGEPDALVSRLPLLGDEERRELLTKFDATARAQSDPVPVHQQVIAQARRTPHALAVRDAQGDMSYAGLVSRASCLARRLRRLGLGKDEIVGVCLPRSQGMVVAELGILMAGAAYLAVDAGHPAARLAFIFTDAGTRRVVTSRSLRSLLPPELEVLYLDDPNVEDGPLETSEVAPSDLAYVVYTSGSTGKPKGAMLEHGSLSNFIDWTRSEFGVDATGRVAYVNSPAFDPTVTEIWTALTAGASLHAADDEIRLSPPRLQKWMLDEGITFTDIPTVLGERLLALPWPETCALQSVLVGGERLRSYPTPALPWRLYNVYGPTEATVITTFAGVPALAAGDPRAAIPPSIGRPITGMATYVLDRARQPVPIGVAGELYIGGVGVARGYVNRPELSAERFSADPFSGRPSARLYRTGDRVRYLADGRLEFLGRVDAQVKIRGYRVEPEEIASVLRVHPSVADAHVVAREAEDHEIRLVAYVAYHDHAESLDATALREHLAVQLPVYMHPTLYVTMDTLPRNSSGKVDARALPEPVAEKSSTSREPPSTDLERQLVAVWKAVLGRDDVGVDDNFFDLGGHSLRLGEVHHELTKMITHRVPIVRLFEFPTIRALTRHLGEGDAPAAERGETLPAPRGPSRLQSRRGRLASTDDHAENERQS